MKISVITVTRNSAATVRDTFDSILRQSYTDYECIVIDGGSTDGTLDIIREYEPLFEGRMHWVSQPDKGIYDAMNKGISGSCGDVVGILNSDDFYTSSDILQTVAYEFENSPQIDAVYGDVHYVRPDDLSGSVRHYSSRGFKKWMMRLGFMPAHPSFYCRRQVYERFRLDRGDGDGSSAAYGQYFDTEYRIAADFENLLRLIYTGGINAGYVRKDFVTMRTGGVSSSGLKSHLEINREHFKALKSNGVYSNVFLLGLRYVYKLWEVLGGRLNVAVSAALLAVLNTVLFHVPLFSYTSQITGSTLSRVGATLWAVVLVLAASYLLFYLFLHLGKIPGKILSSAIFICNSVSLYFIGTFNVVLDNTMMANVLNTDWKEATSFLAPEAIPYILFTGILPCVLVWRMGTALGKLRRFLRNVGIASAAVAAMLLSIPKEWAATHGDVAGGLLLPWSYTVNFFRIPDEAKPKVEDVLPTTFLPRGRMLENSGVKEVAVLVIGESARRENFSLYGYERNTNPLLSKVENLTAYKAKSAATYTIAGVRAILSACHEKGKHFETLPNYLYRIGVDVIWKSNNLKVMQMKTPRRSFCKGDSLVVKDLADSIRSSGKDRVFVLLHLNTSHGPSYHRRYPKNFAVYPDKRVVDGEKRPEWRVNAYDNTIVYTDWLLNEVINSLKSLEDWRSCMFFVSDHGESLGEKGLFMHGTPMQVAPPQQYEIPFIVWTSDGTPVKAAEDELTQYHVAHSIFDFLHISTPIYREELNVFADREGN